MPCISFVYPSTYISHLARRPVVGTIAMMLLALCFQPALAGQKAPTPTWKWVKNHARIDVEADGTTTTHRETAYMVLTESAAREWNEQSISYHENSGTLEDVVAYTLKPDGTRHEIPPTNVQLTSHNGINGLPPAFSDIKDHKIIYPDVEPGDTIYLSYTLRNEKPSFPGYFSLIWTFPDKAEVQDAELIVTAPAKMGLKTVSYNVEPAVITTLPGHRRQWRWTYHNPPPATILDESNRFARAWRYPDSPTIEISSFKDYGEVAAAYAAGVASKAAVTERIEKLAADIVADASTPREKAKRIYDWVVKEISFAGNCLSGGDVVPRSTDLILNMKMGDCKDHATLLQALWAAQGIRSTQVLVNTGSIYELPEIPCWQAFNHAFNYLPDFSIYADATASTNPFGTFPDHEHAKPVLHVAEPARILKTPPIAADANRTYSRSTIKIFDDGSVDVHQRLEAAGSFAHRLRHDFSEARKSPDFGDGEQIFRRYLEKIGYKGSGAYEHIDDTADDDLFSVTMRYHVESLVDTSNPYGMTLTGLFPPPGAIAELGALAAVGDLAYDFICQGDRRNEELVFEFPNTVQLLAIPHGVRIRQSVIRYDSSYVRRGNRVTVRRALADDSPAPICKAETLEQFRTVAQAIKNDLKTQAVYQPRHTRKK